MNAKRVLDAGIMFYLNLGTKKKQRKNKEIINYAKISPVCENRSLIKKQLEKAEDGEFPTMKHQQYVKNVIINLKRVKILCPPLRTWLSQ